MPRDVEEFAIRIRTTGLRKAEKLTQINEKWIRFTIQDMINEIGEGAVHIMRANAPERSGRLRESIKIQGQNRSASRPEIRIGANVRSEDGFPYLNVTRFGRQAIEAKKQRPNFRPDAGIGSARMARSYNWSGKDTTMMQTRPYRGFMLKFQPELGGTFLYRRRVKAYHPGKDWVRSAAKPIAAMGEKAMLEVSEEIEKILERGGAPRKVTVGVRSSSGKVR